MRAHTGTLGTLETMLGGIAFLASLTNPDYKEQGLKELARQRALSRTSRPQRDTKRAFGPKPPRPKPPQP